MTNFIKTNAETFCLVEYCSLSLVPSTQYLSEADEKRPMIIIKTLPRTPTIVDSLAGCFAPLQDRLASNSHGLDFGSGPGPTLSVMFEEIGHAVTFLQIHICMVGRSMAGSVRIFS